MYAILLYFFTYYYIMLFLFSAVKNKESRLERVGILVIDVFYLIRWQSYYFFSIRANLKSKKMLIFTF